MIFGIRPQFFDQLLFFTPFDLIHIILHAMPESPLKKTVENGIGFLSKIFSLKPYLHFPLLNATLFGAIKRVQEWDGFRAIDSEWITRWEWIGPETPDWKKER